MTAPYPPPGVPDESAVADDIPCRKCAYNLRGLGVAGQCPECGTPVGVSIQGNLLRFSDPQWILGLRKGVHLILWGALTLIVLTAASRTLMQVVGLRMASFVTLGAYAMMIWGAWLLTEPDPSGVGEDLYGTVRRVIRFALLVGAANHLVGLLLAFATLPPPAFEALRLFAGIASLVGLIGQVAQLSYLSKLAKRIPDLALVERARFLMYALGLSYGGLIVLGILILLMSGQGGPPGGSFMIGFGLLAMAAGVAMIVFGVMYLLMLNKFARRFTEQAELARAAWSAGGAPVTTTPEAAAPPLPPDPTASV